LFYAVALATLDGIEQDADQLARTLKYNDVLAFIAAYERPVFEGP
jgi:hypothetical protein